MLEKLQITLSPGKFIKPKDPSAKLRELEERIRILDTEQIKSEERIKAVETLRQAETKKLKAEQQRAELMAEERSVWETIAEEQEQKLTKLKQQHESNNKNLALDFSAQTEEVKASAIKSIEKSPFDMSEAETRVIIDAQLRESLWIVDSENLTYGKGSRPEKGRSKAIAEWPTRTGPADYVLFNGLTPVAVIEAKKSATNVYSAIDQEKCYASGLIDSGDIEISNTWGEYKAPLVFATNGRPYLKQLQQESGIWFLDVRDNTNHRRVLQGWYNPQEIKTYLKQHPQQAQQKLEQMDFAYDFSLRPYQIEAIKAVENTINKGSEKALVAMATGTGKTKTVMSWLKLTILMVGKRIIFLRHGWLRSYLNSVNLG